MNTTTTPTTPEEATEMNIFQRKQIAKEIARVQKTSQFEMATNLLEEVMTLVPVDKNLTPMVLLDALGCAGLSLTVGEDASLTFIEITKDEEGAVTK